MNWTRGHSIGRGSSAMVSVAKTHGSSEVFAVKSMEFWKSQILQREQSILSSLTCSQIVGYTGCDVTNENGKFMYNLFMEYVAGGSLGDTIRSQGGRIDESTIRSHTRDVLFGLDYLHMNGLVHCDIKGGNILIGKEGAKIADLGCAKWVVDDHSAGIRGTPVFMAPEVARAEQQSFPADIWALGCTLIEMATGSPPWADARDPVSALYRIAFSGHVPETPTFLSEQAKDFLSKCLVRDPKERWTATQLLQHPFLEDPNSHSKQLQDSFSNSPTSILDQGFWDSMEESDTLRNLTHVGCSSSSSTRIGRICSPVLPNWSSEEDWVTIRSIITKEEERYVAGHEEEMELCETSVSEMILFGHSCDGISKITSNSCSSSDCLEICKSCNLKFEIQREFLSLDQNLL